MKFEEILIKEKPDWVVVVGDINATIACSITAKKLQMPLEKVVITVAQQGNTSAASIPLALDTAVRSGDVKAGELLLLEGFGGGFTWGVVLWRW